MAFLTRAVFEEMKEVAGLGRVIRVGHDLGFASREHLEKLADQGNRIGLSFAHLDGFVEDHALLQCNNGAVEITAVRHASDVARALPSWVGMVISHRDELRINSVDERDLVDGLFMAIQTDGLAVADCQAFIEDEVIDSPLRLSVQQWGGQNRASSVKLTREDGKDILLFRPEKASVLIDDLGFESDRLMSINLTRWAGREFNEGPQNRIWSILHRRLSGGQQTWEATA